MRFEKFKHPISNGSTARSADDRNPSSSNSAASKLPRELAHCDAALVERIEADILHKGQTVTFEDISGLLAAKACVIELICWYVQHVCKSIEFYPSIVFPHAGHFILFSSLYCNILLYLQAYDST
ncbi:hypothetical protein EON65_38535 [archaeon]|nr:MAG: hypothetical protein EON65_38535 [archaeon]